MKLRGREKRALWAVLGAAYATGAALFVVGRWVRVMSAIGPQHHPAEFWVRVLHFTGGYAAVLALGYLIPRHIRPGLRGEKRKTSGVSLLSLASVLGVTAIAILYSGDGPVGAWSAQVHDYLGLAAPILFLFHSRKTRRIK